MTEKAVVCGTGRDKSATGTVNYPSVAASYVLSALSTRSRGRHINAQKVVSSGHVGLIRIAMKVRVLLKPCRAERSFHVG